MRRGALLLLALWLAALALAPWPHARADVSDITLLGDQAALMGGAVTASTQAGPSMWYNPARLAFAGDQTVVFAVSGAGFALRRYKLPGLVDTPAASLDARTTEILALPRATTLVARARERLYWGIGFLIPTRQDIALQAGEDDPSETRGFNAYALRQRRNSFHVTGSVSYNLSDRLQLGASLAYVSYSYFRMSQLSSAAYDEITAMATAVVTDSVQADNAGYGFRPTVGLAYRLYKGLTLGLSASAPTMLFFARLREVASGVNVTSAGVLGFDPEARDERGGTWDVVEPAVGRVGLSYLTERTLWEIDGELNGGAHSDDFNVDARVTGNLRAGGLVGLRRHVRLGFGFFTDLEHKQGALKQVGDTRMRGLGGTLGLNFISRLPGQAPKDDKKGSYSITVATRYAHFKGQVLGLRIAQSGDPATIETVATDGAIHEFSLQFGVNGAW